MLRSITRSCTVCCAVHLPSAATPRGGSAHKDTVHSQVFGPGGQNLVKGPDGGTWMTYHSADPVALAAGGLSRELCLAPITWSADGPVTALTWMVPENTQSVHQLALQEAQEPA